MSHIFPYRIAASVVASVLLTTPLFSLEISVDYRYDTNSFFDPSDADGQLARAALEAAALRYSNVISTQLSRAILRDDRDDPRIGFTHPGTGNSHQVSAAGSTATDSILVAGGAPASEYTGGFTIAEDEWILYAGGRPISSAGFGGTGTGTNFSNIYAEGDSHLNRNFRDMGSIENLPVWGGAITFDNSGARNWHFDHTTAGPSGTLDFYTIALHEIGHALGMASGWQEWGKDSQDSAYIGSEALAAHNEDNELQLNALNLESVDNTHWKDGAHDSFIYPGGNPNLVGTVGLDTPQDLLLEPIANFGPSLRRLELTNIDVASLVDIGWTIEDADVQLACDLDGDQDCDSHDLDDLILSIGAGDATLADRDTWLSDAATEQGKPSPFLLGDVNLDGTVNATDLNTIGQHWNLPTGLWSLGDFDASGITDAADLNQVGINWQESNEAAAFSVVPEPHAFGLLFFALAGLLLRAYHGK